MRQQLSFMRRMGLSCQRELYVCIVNNLGMSNKIISSMILNRVEGTIV